MNGIYFCKLFLESTFTFANWNLNLQLTFAYKYIPHVRAKAGQMPAFAVRRMQIFILLTETHSDASLFRKGGS